jgi:hypothetical protein
MVAAHVLKRATHPLFGLIMGEEVNVAPQVLKCSPTTPHPCIPIAHI